MKKAPLIWSDPDSHRRQIAEITNQLVDGKSNATGSVTLNTGTTTTAVTNERCSTESVVLLMPTNNNAGSASTYVTTSNGSFTINHSNSGNARTFRYVIFTP